MLRKTIIAFAATVALGGAALAPTAASAGGGGGWGGHHHGHFGGGFRLYGGPTYIVNNCYWVKKYTPFGVKLIKVCEY